MIPCIDAWSPWKASSKRHAKAMEFCEDDEGRQRGPRTIFHIGACYGVNVRLFSALPDEDEVALVS